MSIARRYPRPVRGNRADHPVTLAAGAVTGTVLSLRFKRLG
jgi:hypothetical protein